MIEFFVAGDPMPKGSKSRVPVGGGGYRLVEVADLKKKTRRSGALKRWMNAVAAEARRHCREPVAGAVWLSLQFLLRRPKTVTREHAEVRPDTSKLARGVEDALENIAFANDAQVVRLHADKAYAAAGQHSGVLVRIGSMVGVPIRRPAGSDNARSRS